MSVRRRAALVVGILAALVVGLLYTWKAYLGHGTLDEPVEARIRPEMWQAPKEKPKSQKVTDAERDELIKRAQLWRQPTTAIEHVSFAADPSQPREIECRFLVTELGGTTPKFDCTLEDGEQVRVKSGKTGEVPGEVASTRLLRTLGFGGDHVQYVETLRCYGCPKEPFSTMKAVEITQAQEIYKSLMLDYDDFETFQWAAIERKFEARAIETEQIAGWGMFELDKVDPTRGGAPRAHVDALRLFAVFLAHWDNKTENQRLVCLAPDALKKGDRCEKPFLLLQDVGSTFGPSKVDLEEWSKAAIWEDRKTCLTSMRGLPFGGATFGQAHVSEDGRRFLAGMLGRLSDRQLTDLLTTARFDDALGLMRRRSPIADWVRVFKERVRQIAEGPACPALT